MKKLACIALTLILLTATPAFSVSDKEVYAVVLLNNAQSVGQMSNKVSRIADRHNENRSEDWRIRMALISGRINQVVDQARLIDAPYQYQDFHSRYMDAMDDFGQAARFFKQSAIDDNESLSKRGLEKFEAGFRELKQLTNSL